MLALLVLAGFFITPVTVISSNDGMTMVEDLRGNLYSYYGETQNEAEQVIMFGNFTEDPSDDIVIGVF